MDERLSKVTAVKSVRPVRNRKYSRKSFNISHKAVKRLFTPEIKRYLKEWLVRRRDNPYPNREEKKQLANETGLTYTQICNWFANWRRKLKNASSEQNRKTWGHLIKTYNDQARGNVEQFSISSDDSIWGENETTYPDTSIEPSVVDHCYTSVYPNRNKSAHKYYHSQHVNGQFNAQCYHVSSTTEECKADKMHKNPGNKYKNHIIEKYYKGLQLETESSANVIIPKSSHDRSPPVLLKKWLESAENFQPSQSNYASYIPNGRKRIDRKQVSRSLLCNSDERECKTTVNFPENYEQNVSFYDKALDYRNKEIVYDNCIHGKEEVEAAVTLTRLASLHRS